MARHAGARQALGRSRGGFSTKIHLRTNAKGDPLTFDVTGGEAHEVKGYDALMELHDNDPDRLLGDKGYDSDNIRNDLAERGIEPVIPPRSNRKVPIEYDREAYKRRNLIERWSTGSSNSAASPHVTRKPPELIFRCYVLRPHSSGSKLSTRPNFSSIKDGKALLSLDLKLLRCGDLRKMDTLL